jgi:hypothetical protein
MLDRIAANGVRTILVESPDRFARDLTVQLIGHDFLLGVDQIPTTAPDFSPFARRSVRNTGEAAFTSARLAFP